jgi:hypothetical protein
MTFRPRRFRIQYQNLKEKAARSNKRLHQSSIIEIDNYLRHYFVRSLGRDDKEKVIREIGRLIIEENPQREIGGRDVREVIRELCNDAFEDCSGAARNILKRQG